MHEEMSRKEDTGKVGLKRSRHRIETAGAQCRHSRRLVRGKSCQGISCCHKSSCHLSAEIDLPAFCYSAFTHPEFFLPSHNATETFLCVDSCCRHKQVTMAPVWDHEVSAVRCYWTWQKRISGPVGGENSRPAVENQLVSRPASPAPSASHLLDLLGGLLNLCASRSSQRLCHRIWPYRGSSTMTVK